MSRTLNPLTFLIFSLAIATAGRFAVAEPSEPSRQESEAVDFARDVYPIFRRACFECHGEKEQEAGLRLDEREEVAASGMIEAGDPEQSELMRRITLAAGEEGVMPAVGEPLSPSQVAVIRRWIEQGAEWPADFEDQGHWAYVAPQRPTLPEVSNTDWIRSPIDHFVMRKLDERGMRPSPPAAPEKLIRRLYLDLIGIPPSPAETEAFLTDPSSQRLEAIVDDLLSRPPFGERWARPWLDLARYADSHGFQRDNLRDIWAYRDWVIQALNDDMPFDQFTIEQIAGDLLPAASESQRIATGFHRCAPTNVEAGSLPEETRTEQIIDRVNTTGSVWLGTTLECCQCHDHKYDPFTMKEYYQLLAFYNSTEREADRTDPEKASSIQFQGPSMPLSDPQRDARRDALQASIDELESQQRSRRQQLAGNLESWAASLAERLQDAPQRHPLEVIEFASQGDTDSFEKTDDGAIVLVGEDPPETDVYTVRVGTSVPEISAIRLDVLQHDALPGRGPGRGDPTKTNFVLNEFSAEVATGRSDKQAAAAGGDEASNAAESLDFTSATAGFSQKNFDVAGAIDGDAKSGWAIAPRFDSDHWATFQLERPLSLSAPAELRFTLSQQWGKARTIGCFRLTAISGDLELESFSKELVQAATKQPGDWSKEDRRRLLDFRVEEDDASKKRQRRIAQLKKQLAEIAPDTTLVMIELEKPRETHLFMRGDYRTAGEAVEPGTPQVLHEPPAGPANRLTLARWLASRENPLVARVTVNRWWAELFGQGIVTTLEDFGIKGEPPTHPDLLDWLAVELMDNGWSRKQLLKEIVLSATYQQSSQASPERLRQDDQNHWLARGPSFRMSAEMIRDNALAIAGLLDRKPFGPPIRPYQPEGIWSKVGGTAYEYEVSPGGEQYRRGIYVVLKRGSPFPSFINFDATPRLTCTVQRSRTNTPLQALTLLNDPVYVEAAAALAERILRDKPEASFDQRLDYAFQLCTARRPTDRERQLLQALFEKQHQAASEDVAGAQKTTSQRDAWQSIATVLLNLHETITKD